MSTVARLDMDVRSGSNAPPLEDMDRRLERVDCYAIGEVDLGRYAGVVVPPLVDQEHLARHRALLRAYLDTGGTIVFGGHLHRDWLPGASPFVPLAMPTLRDYQVTFVADHPIFADVDPNDLTFRRGVAGFFARGHHPPPARATVLTRLSGGQPTTYVDRFSTAGTILLQSTCDLLGYATAPDSSAARIPGQLLDWIAGTTDRHSEPVAKAAP